MVQQGEEEMKIDQGAGETESKSMFSLLHGCIDSSVLSLSPLFCHYKKDKKDNHVKHVCYSFIVCPLSSFL